MSRRPRRRSISTGQSFLWAIAAIVLALMVMASIALADHWYDIIVAYWR